VPYGAVSRFESDKTNIVFFYESGKLVVQGKGTQEFIEFVPGAGKILKEVKLGYENGGSIRNCCLPRFGVDEESGKGDFLSSGPLWASRAFM